MRMIAIVFILTSLLTACVSTPEPTPRPSSSSNTDRVISKSKKNSVWYLLGARANPAREKIRDRYRYKRTLQYTKISDFSYFHYAPEDRDEPVGFVLVNRGSKRVNPRGLTTAGALRKYAFFYPDRAREDIHLEINDDVRLSRRFSHDNMFRELHFLPRRQLPSVVPIESGRKLKVTLSTGEPVIFDVNSKEIVDGVLMEDPIDFNPSRHRRANPKIRYRGRFLVITVAQRGEAARRDKVWGQTKFAEVHYPAKYTSACRLSPRHIWDQRPAPGDVDPTLRMLHHSDVSLLALIERQCGWNLSEIRKLSRADATLSQI